MTGPSDDLTEGWPDEPDRDDLVRLAGELRGGRPELPEAALARVRQRLDQELARGTSRRWPLRAALAACVLLASGVVYWLSTRHAAPVPSGPAPVAVEPAGVEDHFTVRLAGPRAPDPPEQPLLRLDENQSLFTN
jgi:hypothetical protein